MPRVLVNRNNRSSVATPPLTQAARTADHRAATPALRRCPARSSGRRGLSATRPSHVTLRPSYRAQPQAARIDSLGVSARAAAVALPTWPATSPVPPGADIRVPPRRSTSSPHCCVGASQIFASRLDIEEYLLAPGDKAVPG